jgi:hypothetical protein
MHNDEQVKQHQHFYDDEQELQYLHNLSTTNAQSGKGAGNISRIQTMATLEKGSDRIRIMASTKGKKGEGEMGGVAEQFPGSPFHFPPNQLQPAVSLRAQASASKISSSVGCVTIW